MTTANTSPLALEEFTTLLDTYGSDAARWPPLRRHAAEALLRGSAAARNLHREAAALDLLLAGSLGQVESSDMLPAHRLAALTDQIVTRATAGPRIAASAPKPTDIKQPETNTPAYRRKRDLMQAAALMAASLIAGLYLGQSPLSSLAVPAYEEMAGLTIAGQPRSLMLDTLSADTFSTAITDEE